MEPACYVPLEGSARGDLERSPLIGTPVIFSHFFSDLLNLPDDATDGTEIIAAVEVFGSNGRPIIGEVKNSQCEMGDIFSHN